MTQVSESHDDGGDHDSEIAPDVGEDRVASRAAGLTAEEETAGVEDPEALARAVLADSDERMIEQAEDPEDSGERRTSDEATEPM